VDVAQDSVIVESSGTVEEIDALVALLGGFGIREMVRTGSIVMGRGSGVVGLKEG
jgi:acetolactate synthase-1/3 small subunit